MTLENDLKKARTDLDALKAELPNYHALLTDNETEVQRLKVQRAPLDEQAQARGRVQVARELLEQHQSDLATARAEVARLEVEATRERTLDEMAAYAKEAARQRQALEGALEAANAAMLKHLAKIDATWGAMTRARDEFLDLGLTLSAAFGATTDTLGLRELREGEHEAGLAALEEVKARGADLTDVLAPIGYERTSILDRANLRQIKQPEPFSQQLHTAVQVYRRHKLEQGKNERA